MFYFVMKKSHLATYKSYEIWFLLNKKIHSLITNKYCYKHILAESSQGKSEIK